MEAGRGTDNGAGGAKDGEMGEMGRRAWEWLGMAQNAQLGLELQDLKGGVSHFSSNCASRQLRLRTGFCTGLRFESQVIRKSTSLIQAWIKRKQTMAMRCPMFGFVSPNDRPVVERKT